MRKHSMPYNGNMRNNHSRNYQPHLNMQYGNSSHPSVGESAAYGGADYLEVNNSSANRGIIGRGGFQSRGSRQRFSANRRYYGSNATQTNRQYKKSSSGPDFKSSATSLNPSAAEFIPNAAIQNAPPLPKSNCDGDAPENRENSTAGGRANSRDQSSRNSYGDRPDSRRNMNSRGRKKPNSIFSSDAAPRAYHNGYQRSRQNENTPQGDQTCHSKDDIRFKKDKKDGKVTSGKSNPKSKKNVTDQKTDDETQRGCLIEQLTNNCYECMVCCDIVRRDAAVWSCQKCYHVYHLSCVKKWARSSAASVEGSVSGWRCPACQNVTQRFPGQYRCFCGKVRDPEFNRRETPHSCGEVCQRKRGVGCPHSCNILCHPGPCPPCLATITKTCNCGSTRQTVKCIQAAEVKCHKTCKKTLNCGKHECGRTCHAAPCDPCQETAVRECYCGSTKHTSICGSSESFNTRFSCDKVCDRMLECGNHRCTRPCHPGNCDECPMLPSLVTHCPCGKTSLRDLVNDETPRTSCLDPVPNCNQTCDKALHCGPEDKRHRCQLICHSGDCGGCDGVTEVTCRCGSFTRDMPCSEAAAYNETNPFKCERRCKKKRSCKRHKCGEICCIKSEHQCDLICSQKLTCGEHRCEERCHREKCPTCWHVSFDELHCYCGAQVLYPPIQCGTKPPDCTSVCTRTHSCDHPVQHHCHSDSSCPPCVMLTEKWCMGKHELRKNIPCHLSNISCGLPCGRPLPCGQHKCVQICHNGECPSSCSQACQTIRADCSHPCAAPCHPQTSCPRVPCKAEIVIKCPCGNLSERVKCLKGGEEKSDAEYQGMALMVMAMKLADIQDGQSVDISNLKVGGRKTKQLECNSDCAIKERNKRLAVALEIHNPDLRVKNYSPPYSEFLKTFAKQNAPAVASIEKELSKLVQDAEGSKRQNRSHAFPPMNSSLRRVIHELAEFYGCETQSYDQEPNKNVVATAYKGRCWHPKETLTAQIQRELHPKAPTPMPIGSKEEDIRKSVQAVKLSTKYMGAGGGWGGATGQLGDKQAQVVGNKPQSSSQSEPAVGNYAARLKPASTQQTSQPAIDYFDFSSKP